MKLKSIFALALIPQILLINFIKNNPSIIDDYYSYYLYNNILAIRKCHAQDQGFTFRIFNRVFSI